MHALLLGIPEVRADVFNFLREGGSEIEVSHFWGCWCLSAWDVDRGVATRGIKSWNDVIAVTQSESEFNPDSLRAEVLRFALDDFTLARSILPFIITTILDPSSTFLALNPSSFAPSADSATSSHFGTPVRTSRPLPSDSAIRREVGGEEQKSSTTRLDDEPESVEDRNARLRVAAMGTLKWVFGTLRCCLRICMYTKTIFTEKWAPTTVLVAPLHSLLSSSLFWTVLHHSASPPFHHTSHLLLETEETGDDSLSFPGITQGFGFGQTIVRRAGWSIVHALIGGGALKSSDERLRTWIGQSDPDLSGDTPSAVGLISSAILRSAFVEPDSVVRSAMWEPLLMFLTSE